MLTKNLRLGKILARSSDTVTLRAGVNTYHTFQQIHLCDKPDGDPVAELALVRLPSDEGTEVHERRVRFRMKLFHIGLAGSSGRERDFLENKFIVTP